MGRRWQNIHPSEKPNWGRLNEGQRRYAVEQYNLALVRRGIPIDHPIPERPGDFGDWLDEHHEGEEDLRDQLDRDLGGQQQQSEPEESPPYDNSEAYNAQFEDLVHDSNNPDWDPNDVDEGHFEDHHENNNNIFDHPAPTIMADTSTGSSSSAPKRPRAEDGADSSAKAGGKKKLPGTGSAAPMEGGPRTMALPSPRSAIHSHVRYYRKMHKFFSYGIAYKPIAYKNGADAQAVIISTPLMEVPWDRRFFYLNPSEFDLLPQGSSFNKVRIKVTQRNVRVAFPTNSTANNLATLNQNKNIITAVGLYKKINSAGYKYTAFEDNQPMAPSEVMFAANADYTNLMNNLYGFPDNTADFAKQVPTHQLGIPVVPKVYACLNRFNYNHTTVANNDIIGWECLQEHTTEHDGDASTGNTLLTLEYHPVVGLCRIPPTPIWRNWRPDGGNNTILIPRGSHTLQPHVTGLTPGPNGDMIARNIQDAHGINLMGITPPTLENYIEHAQDMYEGIFLKDMPAVQDSVHIGVQPTPALTTTALTSTNAHNTAFTDTQAYWEIEAECEINTCYSTFRPLALYQNVKEGNQWRETGMRRRVAAGLFDGLHVYSAPAT